MVAARKFLQTKQVLSSVLAANAAVIPVAAIPPPHHRANESGADLANVRKLWVGRIRQRAAHEPGKVGIGDQHAERVEDDSRPVRAGALRLDQLAERVELEVGGDDAWYLAAQRRAQRNHWRVDAERSVGRGDERPVRLGRVAIPAPLARVVAITRQIERCDPVVLAVFEDAPHRQSSGGRRAHQIDIPDGSGRCPELVTLARVEDVDAPHLQPGAVVVADVKAVRLRHFAQRGFEQNDGAVVLASLVRSGESGVRRQNPNDRAELRHLGLEAIAGVGAGCSHRRGCRRPRRGMKSRDLNYQQTRRERRDERHHSGRYRDPEPQQPMSSASPLPRAIYRDATGRSARGERRSFNPR